MRGQWQDIARAEPTDCEQTTRVDFSGDVGSTGEHGRRMRVGAATTRRRRVERAARPRACRQPAGHRRRCGATGAGASSSFASSGSDSATITGYAKNGVLPVYDHLNEIAGRTPLQSTTLLDLSGGNDNTQYFASGSLAQEGGIEQGTAAPNPNRRPGHIPLSSYERWFV